MENIKVYRKRNGKWGIAIRETNRANVFGYGKWTYSLADYKSEADARRAAGLEK